METTLGRGPSSSKQENINADQPELLNGPVKEPETIKSSDDAPPESDDAQPTPSGNGKESTRETTLVNGHTEALLRSPPATPFKPAHLSRQTTLAMSDVSGDANCRETSNICTTDQWNCW